MTVAFRLTIYQADGVTADITVTSIRGGTNPYIVDVPTGDGQEVDLLTGAVRSGAYNVLVADVATGSNATGTIRIITNKLEDAQFRQQLLSRRAKLECSRDGGSTFATWTFGYLTALRQANAMTYEFTVSDSRRLESTHTAFTWWSDTNKTTDERREFPNRGCVMGGPMIENFGPLRASGGWEFFWREVQDNYLALAFRAAYEAPGYSRIPYFTVSRFMYDTRNFLQKLPPVATLTGANYVQLRDREYVFAYPSLLAIVTDGTTTWYGSVRAAFTPVSYSGSGAGDRTQGFDIARSNYMYVELDPGQSTSYPSANAVVRVRLVQREVSAVSPIYIDDHPVNIAAKLYATVGIPYSSASVTSTKAAVGDDVRLALRIAEPTNMGQFLADSIFGPFGFSARTNSSGQQEFFPTRIANAATPTTTIAVNDIVGDAPPSVFEVDESTVVTSFKLTTQTLTPFIPDPDNTEPPPADGIVFVNNSQTVQNADTSTFSTREISYTFPGMVHDGSASGIAFVLSTDVVTRFFTSVVAEGFDRFGRGAIASEVQVLANSTAASLQVGDEVIINIPYYPNKNYRIGESNVGTRIAQVVRRTESPEGPIFKLIDSGVSTQPTSPTFTVASWSGDPRRVAAVTVTNASTLNSSDITLAVQYQVSATTPTRTGTLFTRFRPGTIPTIAFLLPIAPPGSKVWVRMRTEKTELRASAWTAWTSVTLNAWTAPTSLATSAATANSMTLTWSLNGNTADPIDVFAYPGASAPADWTPYRINTFSAGSTTTVVRDLIASTQYTFGVAFRDVTTGAYSAFDTETATTAGSNTTSCPAAPKMKIIPSFENAGATTGVVLSIGAIEGYNIVVQRAPDSSGSPGTWADIAVLLPLTGYYADILPSDGVTRWYRVFYRLSGFLDGAAGTARSATPIAIPDDLVLNEGPSIIAGGATLTLGNYLTGGSYDGSVSVTTNVDATPNNTASKVVARDASGNFTAGTITAALSGNASTATALQTARAINGVSFDGTADITVTAAAGTLTGNTLAAGVVNSSLTQVGTIATGVWQGTSVGKDYGGTGLTSSAFSGITNERVFAYDGGSGAFFVAPSGSNGQALIYSGGALAWGNPAPGTHVLATTTGLGPEHTTSGLTTGMILQATGATTARFQTPSIPASSVTAGTFSGASYTITNDLTVSGTLTASLPFSSITSKPTTLSGYGITDALSNSTSSTQNGYFGDIFLWDDTNPSHYLQITNSADLSATRTLSINVNDASRTVSLSGNLTVSGNADISGTSSGTNTGDQTITLTGAVTGSGTGSFATTYAGTVPIAKGGTNKTSYTTTGTGTRVAVYDQSTGAFDVVSAGTAGQFLKSAGTAGDVSWDTPPTFTSTVAGYAPASGGGTSNFLRADGTWAVPAVGSVSANNVTAGTFAGATYTFSNSVTFSSGVRVAFGETYKILNSGGTAIDVLSATTLGSGVVNSSLTSVGTLTSLSINGDLTVDTATLKVDSANDRVGIGTASPSAKFHVSNGSSYFYIYGTSTGDFAAPALAPHAVTGDFTVYAGAVGSGTERFKITQAGKVSVGSSVPMTQQFQVQGAIVGGTINGTGVPNPTGITNQLAFEVRSSQAGAEPAIAYHKENVYTFYLQGQNSTRGLRLYGPTNETAPSLFVAGSIVAGATTAPNTLYINNTAAADVALFESSQTYSTLAFKSTTNTDTVTIGIDGSGNAAFENKKASASMSFVLKDSTTASRTRLHILENGNIGIGTTSPAYRLVVAGTIHSSTGGFRFPDGTTQTTAATASQWTTSGSDIYYNTGNVGIGTTGPANPLDVRGNNSGAVLLRLQNTSATGYSGAHLYDNSGTIRAHFGWGNASVAAPLTSAAYFGTIASAPIVFTTADVERVRIVAGGDVGIGTSSPGAKLHVVENGNTAILQSTNSTGYMNLQLGNNATTNGSGLAFFGTAFSTSGPYRADGYYIYTNRAGGITINSEGSGPIYLETANATRFFINSSGNIGVGTTSPQSLVDVRGLGMFGDLGSLGAYNSNAQLHVRRNSQYPHIIIEGISYVTGAIAMNGTSGMVFGTDGGGFAWRTGCTYNGNFVTTGTERMTMTSAGKVEINGGGWNSSRLIVTESSGSTAEINGTSNTANQSPLYVWNNVESGSTYFISFYSDGQNNARTLRGYINYRRDNATLNLTTASDYRIKTIHGRYTKSGEVFDKIKIHEGTINGESGRFPMVLAHELDEAYPPAVEGEKDAVNEDGTPKLQMVSYVAMIPVMLAEIKSLRERVAQLEKQ